ncbi:hypothetical protein CRYUN_Cryun25bG0065700 [Craigia yunnanensis]
MDILMLLNVDGVGSEWERVSDLIDDNTKEWKVEALDSLFDTEVSSQICSIPISRGGRADVLVWMQEGNGIYSVKSGYRFFVMTLCHRIRMTQLMKVD